AGAQQFILPPDSPRGEYDYLITDSTNPIAALREEIKKQLGLVIHAEPMTTNVLALRVSKSGVHGLRLNSSTGGDSIVINGDNSKQQGFSMSSWAQALGSYFLNTLVVDETRLTNNYDFTLKWNGNINDVDFMNQLLQNEFGLELVPDQRCVE